MSSARIHPSAVVDEGVEIGAGTKIWHFCHLSRGAKVGLSCTLGQNCFLGQSVRVGDRVKIQNNVSIYSGVQIDHDVFIGPSVVFTNVKRPRAAIDQRAHFSATLVGKGATIGANATIVCGTEIGEGAFIAAGSVVTKSVAPYALVQGNPARQVGWVDESGDPAPGPPQRAPDEKPLPTLTDENAPFQDELGEAARRVLQSGHFIQGDEVVAFESAVAEYIGAEHVVSCSNGSDALLMALLAQGIGPGDEVITSPYSFFATAESIVRAGARPVFVDIESDSFLLDVDLVLGALTERTRAVLYVHLFGQAQDLSRLRSALRDRSVCLIEDAAQAFGATTEDGHRVGASSDFACFSFFPSKNLGGFGDGGLVTTRSVEMANQLRALRRHGASTPHHHDRIGGNFRMDALQAALLRAKLPHVPTLLARRKRNAEQYFKRFESASIAPSLLALPRQLGPHHTYNQFVIRSPERDALNARLREKNINCPVYYPTPLHRQPAMQALVGKISCPHAERAAAQSLALPVYPALEPSHIDQIASAVIEFFRGSSSRTQ